MTYELEEALKFEKASAELIEALNNHFPKGDSEHNFIEYDGLDFEFNGEHYSVIEVGEDPTEDQGKYQYSGIYYQLVKYDPNIASWPCEKNILVKYDVQVYLSYSRTGSYYSEWYYQYEEPKLQLITIVDVPEVVIPAHQEVKTETIE